MFFRPLFWPGTSSSSSLGAIGPILVCLLAVQEMAAGAAALLREEEEEEEEEEGE